MLHYIREKAQGWVAWLIVGLISIPFALWGLDSYLTGESSVTVATVNGEDISQSDLQAALQQYRDQMRSSMGEEFDPAMFEGSSMRFAVVQDLIDQRLLEKASDELGQRIADSEIANIVRQTEVFQVDGQFNMAHYQTVLARAGYSPAAYEAQLKNDLIGRQLVQNLERSTVTSTHEVERLLRLEQQQREIAFGVLSIEAYLEDVSLPENAARDHYDANQAAYTAPEQIAVNYLRLTGDKLADNVEVDETLLKSFYADNREQFVGPEQRRASHILIEGDDTNAQEKIADLATQLADGADFVELAKAHSQDSGSAEDGGDLGFFSKGVMDPAFEEAVFALDLGEVSEPVQTEFGYHLIKLTEIDVPAGADFSEARDEVEAAYRRQQARDQFFEQVEQLANLTYENPESLDIAAEALGLEIQTTSLFTQQGKGEDLMAEPAFIEAAFSDDVLNHDMNSTVIELSLMDAVVLRKARYQPAQVLPFDSVGTAIEQNLKYQAAAEAAAAAGQEKITELEAGAEPETVFADGQWQAATFYGRDNQEISQQILSTAFSMPRSSDVSYEGFTAENGNYIVVALMDVRSGDLEAVSTEQRDGMEASLTRLNTNTETQAFIAGLREKADIEIYDERISRAPEQ
ncbi:Peptidyl-prolyl cis-trans isomerase ppiD [Methylophaga frappieri]|uniref:Periplasmic chaperone PpiD n=1 Tax=Methylophaga frappieri (strain ATCC BAA-2434 / DSM 25690 / JAM7) TaxID=754477 RepID=I1YL42_METFJ|nr:SurA N-terminal domain-containing protein [Methylophaga frappieri]AFJ03635.1 Peptidyl-prolyl cis-trans isomerase ppiD [Methylophaga frappieri]